MAEHDICPGCGRWVMSEEPWDFPGLIHLTPEQRVKYDAEEEIYKAAHGNCHAHRWTMQNSLTMHCGKCCPVPPFGAKLNRPSKAEPLDAMRESFRKLFPET